MNRMPKKSKLIQKELRATDNRGEIISIIDAEIFNVSIITCENNSIRSNHYHKKDFHFMYVLEGQIDYFFKDLDTKKISYYKVVKGDTIFTPPLEIHATYFPIKTTLIVCSKNPRDQLTYEKDTVRVEFINNQNINKMLEIYADTI